MAIALFVIGILLIILNISAVKKEKKSFSGTLSHAESNMKEFEVEIGKLRREFTETIIELQSEIAELRMKKESDESEITEPYDIETTVQIVEENSQEFIEVDEELSNGNSIKINEISKFLEQDMSVDDIAEKLGIGKGEVLLIKELYLK
jgi:uncharacterized protein YoxC